MVTPLPPVNAVKPEHSSATATKVPRTPAGRASSTATIAGARGSELPS